MSILVTLHPTILSLIAQWRLDPSPLILTRVQTSALEDLASSYYDEHDLFAVLRAVRGLLAVHHLLPVTDPFAATIEIVAGGDEVSRKHFLIYLSRLWTHETPQFSFIAPISDGDYLGRILLIMLPLGGALALRRWMRNVLETTALANHLLRGTPGRGQELVLPHMVGRQAFRTHLRTHHTRTYSAPSETSTPPI